MCAACTGDAGSTLLLISVSGVPEDAQTLLATSYLEERPEIEPALLPATQPRFVVRLPPAATGRYRLEIEALGEDRCSFAQGAAETLLTGQTRVDMNVFFSKRLDFHICTLTVRKDGAGDGYVESDPGEIHCGDPGAGTERCAGQFQRGVTVTLRATARSNAAFSGWSEACAGTGTCQVVMSGPVTVRAAFSARLP